MALDLRRDPVESVDIAIVGAGLAGLTAARDLNRAGCGSFLVLEARDRVGGRTLNHDLGGGAISEGGGTWIGPGQTAAFDLARELGVQTFPSFFRGKTVYLDGNMKQELDVGLGGTTSSAPTITKLNEMARGVPSDAPWAAPNAVALDRISLGEWLEKEGVDEREAFSLGRSTLLTYGARPADLSLLYYLSVVNSSNCSIEQLESMKGGAQETRLVGGSQILSLKMAEALGNRVRLSSPVRRMVGWDRDVVELDTDRGVVRARQVIAALSPALCDQITFDPPLPAERAEMQRCWPKNGRYRKTVSVYSRPFWRDTDLNGQVIQVQGPLLWCCDASPPDGTLGVINAFVAPDAVPQDSVEAERVVSTILGQALGEAALKPIQFHDIDWSTIDDWTLTCTAPMPPGFATRWGPHIKAPVGRLIWSGTETADIWGIAMDGAIRSGHRAALQALAALSAT
jgi:monoamine oxidase